MSKFRFTFGFITDQYRAILEKGYKVVTCSEYLDLRNSSEKILINRVDIDLSVKKAERLGFIFNALGVKASFFIRLHALEYNPFSFENYRIIKFLIESGHELGYHSEIVDQSVIWDENPVDCLKRDLELVNKMFNYKVVGVASHRGATGLNNLDFWKQQSSSSFGLKYEAYDFFEESFYISDSGLVQWNCYNKGERVVGNIAPPSAHLEDKHPLIYLLIHPTKYFENHPYE